MLDLGVHERYGNQVFLDSGLLRTLDEITADQLGSPRPDWLASYFFRPERTATQTVADRVEELLASGERPAAAVRGSDYFRSAASYHRTLPKPAPPAPPVPKPAPPRRRLRGRDFVPRCCTDRWPGCAARCGPRPAGWSARSAGGARRRAPTQQTSDPAADRPQRPARGLLPAGHRGRHRRRGHLDDHGRGQPAGQVEQRQPAPPEVAAQHRPVRPQEGLGAGPQTGVALGLHAVADRPDERADRDLAARGGPGHHRAGQVGSQASTTVSGTRLLFS